MIVRFRNMLKYFLVPSLLISLWQLLLIHSTNPFFPTPLKILASSHRILTKQWFNIYFFPTLVTFILGTSAGWFLGIFIGSVMTIDRRIRDIFWPIVNFVRNIPSVAKVPLFIAILGISYTTRVTTVTLSVMFPVLITTMRAIRETDISLMEISRIIGLGRVKRLVEIELPAAAGEILAALQASLQVGLIVTLLSETLGAGRGLGAFIAHSQATFRVMDLWICLITVGVIGLIFNHFFLAMEQKLLPWYFRQAGKNE